MALIGSLQREQQRLHLALASNESGQAARRYDLYSAACWSFSEKFVKFDGLSVSLDLRRTERSDEHVPFCEPQVSLVISVEPGGASCSTRDARWVVCPTAV